MIRTLLLQLRRRLWLQAYCETLARAALAEAGMLCIVVAVHRLPWHLLGLLTLGVALVTAGLAAVWTWWKCPTLRQVANFIDRRADSRDRLTTALAFDNPPTPIHAAALAECEAFLGRFDIRKWTPWFLPRSIPWMLAPLLSITLLQFRTAPQVVVRPGVTPIPDTVVLNTATRLEQMAKQLETKTKDQPSVDFQKVAEALKRSATKLRADAAGEAPTKAKLRELSSLEELIRAAQRGNALDALGDALGKVDDAKDAAEALKKHDPVAAKKLEEFGKRLVEGKNKQRPLKQLEKAMADAASLLGENSGLGSAAAKASSAAQNGDAAGTAQALDKLGQAMGQSNQSSGSGGSSGSGEKSQAMQGMISKLQEMKSGKEDGKQLTEADPSDSKKPGGPGLAMIQLASRQPAVMQPGNGASGDQGKPGSEHDVGTKKSPFGPTAAAPEGQQGVQSQIAGILGGGESLRSMVPAAPGVEPLKTGYKALYQAAQPAAEDAIGQEEIPIGSRLFVKRYFESIRPKE